MVAKRRILRQGGGHKEVGVQSCSEGIDNSMLTVEYPFTSDNRHQLSVLTTLIVESMRSLFKADVEKHIR